MMDALNTEITRKDLRSFGLIFASGVLIIFGLFFPWLLDRPWPLWPWVVAGVVILPALVAPFLLKPLYKLWMKIGHVLGWINTRLILGLVFFVLFAPIALLFRVIGRDAMDRKLDGSVTTYRKPSHHLPRERMEKPF